MKAWIKARMGALLCWLALGWVVGAAIASTGFEYEGAALMLASVIAGVTLVLTIDEPEELA